VPNPSPFPAEKPATNTVQQCPKTAGAGSTTNGAAPAPEKPKPVTPCDLANITITLASDSRTITKTGSRKMASAPLPGISAQVNGLLADHAVVIHRAIPTAILVNQQEQAEFTPSIPVVGRARATATMKANCGQHPVIKETPPPDDPALSGVLSAETTQWEVSDFGKMLFRGKSWHDLFLGDRAAVTFEATTCGAPASGDPVTTLKGVAQVAIADRWEITFVSGKGITLSLAASRHSTRNTQFARGYRGTSNSLTQGVTASVNSVGYSRSAEVTASRSHESAKQTQNLGGGYRLETSTTTDTTEHSIKTSSTDVFVADGTRKIIADAEDCFVLQIKRNGIEIFNLAEITKDLRKLAEALNEVWLRLSNLKNLFENAAMLAFPMSLKFDLTFELTLLKGSVKARIWPDEVQILEGANYYIEERDSKFEVGLDLLLAKLEVVPKIEALAKVISKHIAGLSIDIEGSVAGAVSATFAINYNTTSEIIRIDSRIPMSISATATGYAASFYATAQGSIRSAMMYTWRSEYKFLELSRARHSLDNEQLYCELVVKRGNKILEYIGLSEAKEWFRWPKDGPFIWIEAGAMKQDW
jgi:hypothetical protein